MDSVETSVAPRLMSVGVRRGPYSELTPADVGFFRQILPGPAVIEDMDILKSFNVDWLGSSRGNSRLVLLPSTTKQVSDVLGYCSRKRLAVVPQGGNTGLVGGSVPLFDEIVLSMRNMNKVISVSAEDRSLVCEAGCILGQLDAMLSPLGFMMPLDLGAKDSCHIGGNVATNAGGIRLIRFGSMHNSVLGLEVVLPDGQVMDSLRTLRKDNTGYDLKQLFIGSEGTLGVITKVALQVCPRPAHSVVALFSCRTFEDVVVVFRASSLQLSGMLSAVEFEDDESMQLVVHHTGVLCPVERSCFYILIEVMGDHMDHLVSSVHSMSESLMCSSAVVDVVMVDAPSKVKRVWSLREGITHALRQSGGNTFKYDLSIPCRSMYGLVEETRRRLGNHARHVLGYGHVGDGNLHLNVVCDPGDRDIVENLLHPFVYEWTSYHSGSISAEHGVGAKKAGCITYTKTGLEVEFMRRIRLMLDPNHILNPYKTVI